MVALCYCNTVKRKPLTNRETSQQFLFAVALMSSDKQKWVRSLLIYLSWWFAHLPLGTSFEDSHKVTHVINNPELNFSAIFQSRHRVMTHKDKMILLALYSSGVDYFFSKPERWCHSHKASCLDSDVREQDSTCGNTDDRTVLTPVNLKAVGFPNSTWLCEKLNPPTDLTETF